MSENQSLRFQNKKIAYVDDSKVFISTIGKMVEAQGAEFLGVLDPSLALEQIDQFKPDLIITDLEMPHINGLGLIQRLRADLRFQDIPIVLLTATDDPTICMKAIELGADDFVAKVDLSKILVPKISALLRIRNNNLKLLKLKEAEAITTMIATYKHEFNNVLMILDGKLNRLERSLPSDFDPQLMKNVKEVSVRMQGILKGLDAVQKIETEDYSQETKILKFR